MAGIRCNKHRALKARFLGKLLCRMPKSDMVTIALMSPLMRSLRPLRRIITNQFARVGFITINFMADVYAKWYLAIPTRTASGDDFTAERALYRLNESDRLN